MAMKAAGGGDRQASINMTPMIDILLVLLIIFLVIQPEMQEGIDVRVPAVQEAAETREEPDQIVLRLEPGPVYRLEGTAVPAAALEGRLERALDDAPDPVVFVEGADGLRYGTVVAAADLARRAGASTVALVPRSAQGRAGG